MVIFACNSQRAFPWVLNALQIHPYHFYKVIEVIVRVEDKLPRDMIKHLNRVCFIYIIYHFYRYFNQLLYMLS